MAWRSTSAFLVGPTKVMETMWTDQPCPPNFPKHTVTTAAYEHSGGIHVDNTRRS